MNSRSFEARNIISKTEKKIRQIEQEYINKITEIKRRKTKNFFTDTKQNYIKKSKLEDREQMWWWKNSIISRSVWSYRDRFLIPRGPCTLPVLREAWSKGIIDDKTLVWGTGLIDWIPIRNVWLLSSAIRTPEVQLATSLKKLFFGPLLKQVRKNREQFRMIRSNQIELWN